MTAIIARKKSAHIPIFYILHAQAIENNFDISESEREFTTIGTFAPITITGATTWSLTGELTEKD